MNGRVVNSKTRSNPTFCLGVGHRLWLCEQWRSAQGHNSPHFSYQDTDWLTTERSSERTRQGCNMQIISTPVYKPSLPEAVELVSDIYWWHFDSSGYWRTCQKVEGDESKERKTCCCLQINNNFSIKNNPSSAVPELPSQTSVLHSLWGASTRRKSLTSFQSNVKWSEPLEKVKNS